MPATASTDEQALLRAARAALGWTLIEASRRALVSIGAVLAAEGARGRSAPEAVVEALWVAYRRNGVRRIDDGRGRLGISIGCPPA